MKSKKISHLLVGTNNKGKLREIKALLPKNIKIYSTSDYNLKSPKENGKTFRENSLIKASFFSKKSKQICMSDDSGLEINLLNNQPGIYSARWGGKKNNFDLLITDTRENHKFSSWIIKITNKKELIKVDYPKYYKYLEILKSYKLYLNCFGIIFFLNPNIPPIIMCL